jgi:hypothetical protein
MNKHQNVKENQISKETQITMNPKFKKKKQMLKELQIYKQSQIMNNPEISKDD